MKTTATHRRMTEIRGRVRRCSRKGCEHTLVCSRPFLEYLRCVLFRLLLIKTVATGTGVAIDIWDGGRCDGATIVLLGRKRSVAKPGWGWERVGKGRKVRRDSSLLSGCGVSYYAPTNGEGERRITVGNLSPEFCLFTVSVYDVFWKSIKEMHTFRKYRQNSRRTETKSKT